MGKTTKILAELKTYLDPSLSCDTLCDWFKNEVIIKDPLLYFDCRPDSGIVYVRYKKSGLVKSKFRIECLDKVDDDLSFEENEEDNVDFNPENIEQLSNAVENKDKLQAVGAGKVSENADKALNMYNQAMDKVIASTTETAQKILNNNQ